MTNEEIMSRIVSVFDPVDRSRTTTRRRRDRAEQARLDSYGKRWRAGTVANRR